MPDTVRTVSSPPTIEFIDLRAQRQRIGSRIDDAVRRVLEHGRYIQGPEVAELERRLAEFCGVRHALCCSSGTDALLLALMARGAPPNAAVLVPSFTFAATAEVVVLAGAVPVFVDVQADSFNIDPAGLEPAIETARRAGLHPAAVVPVDLFGQPADHDAVAEIAAAHGMWVLADAAQSFGAWYGGRRVGSIGLLAATSFFPAKPLGAYGDGGAVFTDDDELAHIIESLRVHGQGSDRYDNPRIGINGRLDTLQAAILLEKLAVFEEEIDARQRIAQAYGERLGDKVQVPQIMPDRSSVWAQYTIRLPQRDQVAARMRADGIPTAVYYPKPLHRQPAYADFPVPAGGLPVSEMLAGEVLSLPMHPYLDDATQDRIVAALRAAL